MSLSAQLAREDTDVIHSGLPSESQEEATPQQCAGSRDSCYLDLFCSIECDHQAKNR